MPYLFSCGEDKKVLCFDLEQNKVTRHYHGHQSGVWTLALHPRLDMLMTGGRDAACRVWDVRTSAEVMTLVGHEGTVMSIATQQAFATFPPLCLHLRLLSLLALPAASLSGLSIARDPQLVTGGSDSVIRLWDLRMGRTFASLTRHKKAVRFPTFWSFFFILPVFH
jgi:pleiotropic regulator 1